MLHLLQLYLSLISLVISIVPSLIFVSFSPPICQSIYLFLTFSATTTNISIYPSYFLLFLSLSITPSFLFQFLLSLLLPSLLFSSLLFTWESPSLFLFSNFPPSLLFLILLAFFPSIFQFFSQFSVLKSLRFSIQSFCRDKLTLIFQVFHQTDHLATMALRQDISFFSFCQIITAISYLLLIFLRELRLLQ